MSNIVMKDLTNRNVNNTHIYQMIDNYIYLYHVPNKDGNMGVLIVVPSFADSVSDTLNVSFASETPLSRSAPIYSYQNSGPRTVQVRFQLHRDMMTQINYGTSNASVDLNDDYVDTMIKYIQAAALPEYSTSGKMVNPPMVAVRLGSDIFIKGVISGSVGLMYHYPILANGKYSNIDVSFTVTEVEPYDASQVMSTGSYRGLSTTLERRLWKLSGGATGDPFAGSIMYNA